MRIHYTANINIAFKRIIYICRNVDYGWILGTTHANGASLFFICLYIQYGEEYTIHLTPLKNYYSIQLVRSNFKCRRGPKLDKRVTYHKWRIWKWGGRDDVISQPAVLAPEQLLHQSNWRTWTLQVI